MRLRFHRALLLLLATATALLSGPLRLAGETPVAVDLVTVGIDGHCRVGCWTAVRYTGTETISAIETRDGDGVRVEYRQLKESRWGYAVPGSEAAPLVIHGDSEVVLTTRFPTIGSPARGAAMIPREMRWVIAFGDPLGIDKIGANELLGRDAKIAVSKPGSASSLPDSMLGYDGVDLMVIGGSSAPLLDSLTTKQRNAIQSWIRNGGDLLLTLGQSTEKLFDAAPWLLDSLPLDQVTIDQVNPSALETFTSTQTPLDTFAGLILPKDQGQLLVMGRTTRRVSTPLAVEYSVGFGKIVVIAADLEEELFAAWPERLDLITQLTGTKLVPESDQAAPRSRATAYDDLAGQLRATLDRFSTRSGLSFSIISLVLLALIAAIGPLDYLLVNRLLGRPLLGWMTFPLLAIGLSLWLIFLSRAVPSTGGGSAQQANAAELETNQIEIFDIDSLSGVGRGFAARYFYSHQARRLDIDVTADDALRLISGPVAKQMTPKQMSPTMITAPLGHPGQAFGGIPIAIEDARLPTYLAPFEDHGGSVSNSLVGLPIASRSSKGIVSQCWFEPKLTSDVTMYRRAGSELLRGELINPLPLDLLDGVLVFRNWAYLLPTRFPAGARIAAVANLRQKNFRWKLSRQQALEESDIQNEQWDPTMVDSLDRIAEMLMFHDAAGSTRYTTLRDDPLSSLDLSNLLSDDRCMLVGRLASPLTKMDASDSRSTEFQAASQRIGQTLSLIRVVLPVQERNR